MYSWLASMSDSCVFRDGLGRIYLAIARHLEDISGQDTRAHFRRGKRFQPTLRNKAGDLSQKENILLDDLINKFEKHIAKQYKLLRSGKQNKCPTILKHERFLPQTEQEVTLSEDVAGNSKHTSAHPSEQTAELACAIKPSTPHFLSLVPNKDIVVRLKIYHPALFKAKVHGAIRYRWRIVDRA